MFESLELLRKIVEEKEKLKKEKNTYVSLEDVSELNNSQIDENIKVEPIDQREATVPKPYKSFWDPNEFVPVNLNILKVDPEINELIEKGIIKEVKSREIYKQNSNEFDPEGLFSIEIFGDPGTRERMERFGYINLNLDILHPRAYKELVNLNTLYKRVLEGKAYVIFDEKTKDFVEVTKVEGETGYEVFYKYWDKLDFKVTESLKRKFKIDFLKKYKLKDLKVDKFLVMPAGLRDIIITETGKEMMNEINNYYIALLNAAKGAQAFKKDGFSNEFINTVRVRLQRIVQEIYEYIKNMLEGKSKFLLGKYAKRNLLYGTRNVITADPTTITDLDDPLNPTMLSTKIGVFQFSKAVLPITIYQLRTKFLDNKITPESIIISAINPKTLKLENIEISEKFRNMLVTDRGLEDLINKTQYDDFKNSPLVVLDNKHREYYLFMVVDKGDTIEVVDDPSIVPKEDKKYLRPLTHGEVLFLALFDVAHNYPIYITRYPVTGFGSTDPAIPYLKSTVESRRAKVKLPYSNKYKLTNEYPIIGKKWYNSLSVPVIYIKPLGGDFDGDKVSANAVWKKESVNETKKLLNSVTFFIKPEGDLAFSAANETNEYFLKEFTE